MPERGALGDLTLLGSGGQGSVYHAPKARMNYAAAVAFKEYKPEWRARVDFGALEAMAVFLGARTFEEGSLLAARVAWPAFVVTERGTPVGFLMAEVPADFRLGLRTPSGGRDQVLAQVQHLLNPGAYLARRGIALSDRQRYPLLAHAAETLALLHHHGAVVGDLSPKNILFALEPEVRCFLVDADAMRLAGRSALPQAETPDWEAPAGEELATQASDAYKFGLLALRLLAGDQSTRDPARLPASVPAEVRSLVAQALGSSPGSRPALAAWVDPLRAAALTASSALPVVKPASAPAVPRASVTAITPVVATLAPAFASWSSQPALAPTHGRRRWPWVGGAVAVAWLVLANIHVSSGPSPAAGAVGNASRSPTATTTLPPSASVESARPSAAPFSACPAAGGAVARAFSVTTGLAYSGTQGRGAVEVVVLGPNGVQQGVYSEVHLAATDVLGKPITGDRVSDARSDSTGAARMEVPPGTYAVVSDLAGYHWGDLRDRDGQSGIVVQSGRTTRVTISLGSITFVPTTTAGTLSDRYAEVHLQKTDSQGGVVTGDRVTDDRTDNTGAVSFLLAPGSYVLKSDFTGRNWGDLSDGQGCSSIPVAPGKDTKVALALGRLRVVAPEGTYVEVHLGTAAAPGDRVDDGRADNTGYWTTDLTPGTYVVVEGDTHREVTVESGQVTDLQSSN